MINITMPAMGEGIFEAGITRWMVREGTQVEADQPVAEVATDKIDSEIFAPASGTIHKILLKEGDTVKVGQVMALISQPGMNGMDTGEQAESLEREKSVSAPPDREPKGKPA